MRESGRIYAFFILYTAVAKTEKDYEDLLRLFNKHKVKYCVVGAFAFGAHARPRYTKDIDILVEPTTANAQRIIKALDEFGFKSLHLTVEDFCSKNQCIQLGYEPVRVDLLTSLGGLNFAQVWKNKVKEAYGDINIYFIGLDDLIQAKQIANRKQDLVDLEILLDIKKHKVKNNKDKS